MKFENIYRETEENMRLALLSLWTPGNHPLRPAVEELINREKLLAEPVFQSMFSWEPTHDDSWKEAFAPDVVQKLGIGSKYPPYTHQAESWKALADGKSIVVTSGTGSGKTECFMYPVLNDLCMQGHTNAIEAIFLYPLNALMEDQKKRLSEYCQATNLHFAVYNGDTPEYNADGREEPKPNEIATRALIRDEGNKGTRPEILLTNPSMLEYILVRQKDQKMLQESSGKLRWIIIDEAHSYSGSAAVELSYQIKRILNAFGVAANDVRFACTSATIGGEDGGQSLADFMSTITGQPADRIQVIGGNRLVPEIIETELSSLLSANNLPPVEKVMSLRRKINEVSGMTLRQMWQWLRPEQEFNVQNALLLLDHLCELKVNDSPILSLRAHFFMRSIGGIYACANEHCSHANTAIPQYGYLTTEKEATCPHCGAPLLEVLKCKRCNSFVVMGNSDPQTKKIMPCEETSATQDYFALDNDNGSTDEDETEDNLALGESNTFFILPFDRSKYYNPISKAVPSTLHIEHTSIQSSLESMPFGQGEWVDLRKDAAHSYCPHCGQLAQGASLNLRHFRIPISFINQTIAPVFLKECAQNGLSWGKYIAFTDSRQGTAISAKTFNIDVEWTQVRERTLKKLIDSKVQAPSIDLSNIPVEFHAQILAQLQQNTPEGMTLEQLSDTIFDERIFHHITSTDGNPDKRAYKAALMRQYFGRRPRYVKNMESMGLITMSYPGLKGVKMPSILSDYAEKFGLKIEDKDWQDYLKVIIDHWVRTENHIQPLISGERRYVRDASLSRPIAAPDDGRDNVSHWPSVKINEDGKVSTKQHRIILMLCAGIGIHDYDSLQKNTRLIDALMREAWEVLKNRVFKVVKPDDTDGYNNPLYYSDNRYVGNCYIDLSGEDNNNTARVVRTQSALVCPVTSMLLDTTFMGYSPLIVGELSEELCKRFKCNQTVTMPIKPDDNEKVDEWMAHDERVVKMQKLGLWGDRYKYTYKWKPAYLAAEHSAQQSKPLLRQYTKEFVQNNPGINVLHCSTTMEMGVDIGDIDIVLMDTIPPTAANYLQRVGRAGRARQSKALAFSLCNNTAVGQQAFRDPMWALRSITRMVKVRESQTIVQRHVNSFFFRQFICDNGMGIQANMSVDEFMSTTCDDFVQFLDAMATNQAEKKQFHAVFGNQKPYTIDVTGESIIAIKKQYDGVIKELNEAHAQFPDDKRRQLAISSQIKKCKQENLLGYLSENQFIPNANMPTGVATFDFLDNGQFEERGQLYKKQEKLQAAYAAEDSDAEKMIIQSELNKVKKRIDEINRASSASRDIHTALNEYAPEQTVVVNEKNYISAAVKIFGAYNEETQTRAIYHCRNCGHTDYSPNLQEGLVCPKCGEPYRSIIKSDSRRSSYTLAYEPIGFRTDQNVDGSREEKTEKRFYDIRPVLLKTDWRKPIKVNMCDIICSGDNGNILFYNVGSGHGFAFCKRCGRAAVETSGIATTENIPQALRPGHKRPWKGDCEATFDNIARHVVFTGIHPTCYTVLKFKQNIDSTEYEYDEQLAFSLGVVIRRALAKIEGIDEGEIDFGVKQEIDAWVLFVYDVSKGGCGYSLRLADPVTCQKVFDTAREDLEKADCDCHKSYGACPKCLVDRTNYRYTNLLSKAKALDWLTRQKSKAMTIPSSVASTSPSAGIVYLSLKDILKKAIEDGETKEITIIASDNTGDYSVTDWRSILTEMGRNINKAVEKRIKVNLKVEYHTYLHNSPTSKLPFIDLHGKFPDCSVELIKDMGSLKTALIVENYQEKRRYFTERDDVLSFSEKWGKGCSHVFTDTDIPLFVQEAMPQYETSPKEIVREGLTKATHFQVKNYFTRAIVRHVLQKSDIDFLKDILFRKNVRITFSDTYVNSALASLMLVYLIKEMEELFGFTIKGVTLQLDSPRRKCNNEHFNDYMFINMNFASKEDADKYTDRLFEEVLNIEPYHSSEDADHHRWLRIETEDGGLVEIRPDHGISGGFRSESKYMNLDTLNGTVSVDRNNEDVLFYVIMKKGS